VVGQRGRGGGRFGHQEDALRGLGVGGAQEVGVRHVRGGDAGRREPRAERHAAGRRVERRGGQGAAHAHHAARRGVERGLDAAHALRHEQPVALAGAAPAQVAGERQQAHVRLPGRGVPRPHRAGTSLAPGAATAAAGKSLRRAAVAPSSHLTSRSRGALMTRPFRQSARLAAGSGAAAGATGCASVSQEQEVQMGAQYAQQINQQLPIVRDPEVNRYINVLGDSIARVTSRSDLEWRFFIVDSPEVNAFAVPGGFIYMNRGLIERAQNMAQVAGVLGHEIGHVTGRHSIKQMQQQQKAGIGVNLLCILTPSVCQSQVAGAAISLGANAAFAKFSRQDEADADAEGVRYVTRAGIDPRGIPSMFRILLNERETRPSSVTSFFATHPLEESRINATQAQIDREVKPAVLTSLARDTRNFQTFKARLRSLPRAPQPARQGQ
jgi:Zn-dependent protease with chaperone function